MKRKTDTNKFTRNKFLFLIVFLFFALIIYQVSYLCLFDFKVGNITIKKFIKNRNIKEEVIMPARGSIFDSNGSVLAQDVASYTLIVYLDSKRSEGSDKLEHAEDLEMTASELSKHIKMSKEEILSIISKKSLYQVELGSPGKNLSQLEMEEIKKLNLPGVDFVKSEKRYYSNGNYASYLLGYTVKKERDDGHTWITGEMGIESYYNDILSGSVGYLSYEKDKYGYKIPNGREYIENAQNGSDIYLTIDENIQLFAEDAVRTASQNSEAEWIVLMVADAKTGAILAASSNPSFDPNKKDMVSYIDPFGGLAYEPGSTMKTYTYMCAIDKGTYDGTKTYKSGSKEYVSTNNKDKVTVINDWNKKGWGTITYDLGYALSSNIAVANMMENFIDKKDLKECLTRYGFGSKTSLSLNGEVKGSVTFNYPIEVAAAAYGQGITTTPIQHIQALTAIANNGKMLKPYLVSKIVNPNNDEVIYEGKKEVVDTVAKEETIIKIKSLMKSVIGTDSSIATGHAYYMEGYDVIGKTGTAQIFDYTKGQYSNQYVYSFSGMFPENDPSIIIYAAISKPKDTTNYVAPMVRSMVDNIGKYLDIKVESTKTYSSVVMESYINKETSKIKTLLEKSGINVIILGNGDRIINQYPYANNKVYQGDKVVLLTNNYDKAMIDFTNYSYKDAINTLVLMGVKYQIEGLGYVYEQSVKPGDKGEEIVLKLNNKYLEQPKLE